MQGEQAKSQQIRQPVCTGTERLLKKEGNIDCILDLDSVSIRWTELWPRLCGEVGQIGQARQPTRTRQNTRHNRETVLQGVYISLCISPQLTYNRIILTWQVGHSLTNSLPISSERFETPNGDYDETRHFTSILIQPDDSGLFVLAEFFDFQVKLTFDKSDLCCAG